MGNIYKLPGAAFLLVACVLSCNKTPEEDPVYASEEIILDASTDATKGFLNSGDLIVDGTKFQMFDYLSGYNGTLTDAGGTSHSSGEEFKYFQNSLTYNSAETNWKWVFGDLSSPTHYRWTRTGTHHFFGWMLKDATPGTAPDSPANRVSENFFSPWTPGNKTLTLGRTLTIADPQYDFLYSDVVPVDVISDGIPTTVPIPMKHLFGAIGVAITNSSKVDVVVNSVTLKNFPNMGSETLTYDMSTGVSRTNANPTKGASDYWPNKISSSITLRNINHADGNKTYDASTGAVMGENLNYFLSWPMTYAALRPTITGTGADGNPTYTATSPLIEVNCKVGTEPTAKTLSIIFPNVDDATPIIVAGKKTQLNLNFADKQVRLYYSTLPWDYEEYPMAFENDAVSATQLKFIDGTYQSGAPKITDANGRHDQIPLIAGSTPAWTARGTFKVYTPVNARLTVGLSGDVDYFLVTMESGGTYTGNGNDYIYIDPTRDGGQITLAVKPKGLPVSGKRVFLHFAVTNHNRDTDADTEINRDNYVITIP